MPCSPVSVPPKESVARKSDSIARSTAGRSASSFQSALTWRFPSPAWPYAGITMRSRSAITRTSASSAATCVRGTTTSSESLCFALARRARLITLRTLQRAARSLAV